MRGDERFAVSVCVTAQHRHMLDQVLDLFGIVPDHDLNVMRSHQKLSMLGSRILDGVAEVLGETEPHLVIVHGDTTSAFAAALASYYARIPVGHVEAGLRTNDLMSPWPEEGNRQLVGVLASYHFCPTEGSRENLLREGKDASRLYVTGNTVIDALHAIVGRIQSDKGLSEELAARFPFLSPDRRLILITGHRRESFGKGIERICAAIAQAARRHGDVDFVYPVHLNPQVSEPVNRLLANLANVHLVEPQAYLPFVYPMTRAHVVLTDSGGIQEEAPSLGKPVLVMRDITERPEAVAAGTVRLVGTDQEKICNEIDRLLMDEDAYMQMSLAQNPYGDGHASARIVEVLAQALGVGSTGGGEPL